MGVTEIELDDEPDDPFAREEEERQGGMAGPESAPAPPPRCAGGALRLPVPREAPGALGDLASAADRPSALQVLYRPGRASPCMSAVMKSGDRKLVVAPDPTLVVKLNSCVYMLEVVDLWSPSHHSQGPRSHLGELQLRHRLYAKGRGARGMRVPGTLVLCVFLTARGGAPPAAPERSGADSPTLELLGALQGANREVAVDFHRVVMPPRRGGMYQYTAGGTEWIVFRTALTLSQEEQGLVAARESPRPRSDGCESVQVALRNSRFEVLDLFAHPG